MEEKKIMGSENEWRNKWCCSLVFETGPIVKVWCASANWPRDLYYLTDKINTLLRAKSTILELPARYRAAIMYSRYDNIPISDIVLSGLRGTQAAIRTGY